MKQLKKCIPIVLIVFVVLCKKQDVLCRGDCGAVNVSGHLYTKLTNERLKEELGQKRLTLATVTQMPGALFISKYAGKLQVIQDTGCVFCVVVLACFMLGK